MLATEDNLSKHQDNWRR